VFKRTDVVVDDQIAGRLVIDGHRNREDVHVDKRAVLPGSAGNRMETLSRGELVEVGGVLRVQVLAIGDQMLEVPTDRLSGRVPEELLGRQVPGGDLPVETERDDCGRADLQQRLEVELLLSESARALGRKAFGRGRIWPRSIRAEASPAITHAFAKGHSTPLRSEPTAECTAKPGERRGCPALPTSETEVAP
jgi:hypothetical protein